VLYRYCVSSTRLRTSETADSTFFRTLAACDHNIPIIVVCTRYDDLRHKVEGEVQDKYMEDHNIARLRDLGRDDWEVIDPIVEGQIGEIKLALMAGLQQAAPNQALIGPVFTSKSLSSSVLVCHSAPLT
jgi:GTPase SAR1 family protein